MSIVFTHFTMMSGQKIEDSGPRIHTPIIQKRNFPEIDKSIK